MGIPHDSKQADNALRAGVLLGLVAGRDERSCKLAIRVASSKLVVRVLRLTSFRVVPSLNLHCQTPRLSAVRVCKIMRPQRSSNCRCPFSKCFPAICCVRSVLLHLMFLEWKIFRFC